MPAPIDITPRGVQRPPPKSNLTSQLRAADQNGMLQPGNESYGARPGSMSQNNGIPMSSSRLRRESMIGNDLAKSLMSGAGGGGMSWGGVSVGSWIRDDIMMTGTSPFTFQSPSYHSSSYLPKLEAEFCRDFSCCGLPLPSLHDLLRHYEELHAQQLPMNNDGDNQDDGRDMNRQQPRHNQQQNPSGITSPIGGIGGIQYEMMRQQQMQRRQQEMSQDNHVDDQPEGEITGDMEMDDDEMTPPPNNMAPMTPQHQGQQHLSHPPTPSTLNHQSYMNTSNNVPNNMVNQTSHFSPESSVPGTPLATDHMEFGFAQNMGGFQNHQNSGYQGGGMPYGNLDLGGGDMSLELCIDQPAKRLYSPGGQNMGAYNQGQIQQMMNNGNNMAQRVREESGLMQQAPTMQTALMQQEDKPFKCPVIGCEKAYKNQNGLKYHKAHGHTNQQLHDNSDGTFSIVNPETSAPYPGTLGMEKEKPYRCEYCGKRYKNLNGLKYHRSHSSHPTMPGHGQPGQPLPTSQPVPGGVVAVAGGLMNESGMGLP